MWSIIERVGGAVLLISFGITMFTCIVMFIFPQNYQLIKVFFFTGMLTSLGMVMIMLPCIVDINHYDKVINKRRRL